MLSLSFNDFVHKYNLRNKAKSNLEIDQIPFSLSVSYVGIYLGDAPF